MAATLANNSDTITVSGEYVDFSKADDYLVALDNGLYVLPVLSGTAPDSNGDSALKLASIWSGATLTNKSLFIFPTFAKIYESVTAMTALNGVTRGILTKLKDLLTDTKPTLDIGVGQTSSIETVPYGYLVNQVIDLIAQLNGLLGSVQAMTKAEFDRARLNELNNFPVAGTDSIDFDSSYEFQQINGWQNKFRINANKTCIDGVWHNYSNSDITLPAAPDGLDKKDLSGRFTNLAAAIMAGGDDLSQSYLNQRCIVYAVQKDIAAPFGLSTAYIQTAENNIYSNNGVLRQRSFEFVAERLLESVVIEGANTYQSTMNAMASIGWSQDSDVLGQFKKGDDIAVGLTIVQRINQGAYHPVWNSEGCSLLLNGSNGSSPKWYGLTTGKPSSIGDCFKPAHRNPPWVDGDRAKVSSIANGVGFNGRPDGKFYDAIYASDVKDLRMSSKKLPRKEIHEKYERIAISGEVRGFEGVPFTVIETITDVSHTANTFFAATTDALSKMIVGQRVWIQEASGYVERTVATINIDSSYFTTTVSTDRVNGNLMVIGLYQTHKQANPTWTDIIGSPENIAATFPDGVQGQWIPVIPDGTPKDFPLNRGRKSLAIKLDLIFTDNQGVSWTIVPNYSVGWDAFKDAAFASERVELFHYETQAHFTQDDALGDALDKSISVIATNNHNDAILVSSLTGNVSTGSDALEELTVTKTVNGVVSHTAESMQADVLFTSHIENDNGVAKFVFNIDDSGVIDGSKAQSFNTQYFITEE